MKSRFLTLTLGLVMALASVSVFADDANTPDNPQPVPPMPSSDTGNNTLDPAAQGNNDGAPDQTGNNVSTPAPQGSEDGASGQTGNNVSAPDAQDSKNDAPGQTENITQNSDPQSNNAGKDNANSGRFIDETPKSRNAASDNFPQDPASLLNAPVPQYFSAVEYLSYIQSNEAVMQNVIAAYTQGQDEKNIPAIKMDIVKIFMEKNLEAANAGLSLNAKESDFLALAITKAEILLLKARLHNEMNAQAELDNFLDELEDAGKDYTLNVVMDKVKTLESKIDAYHFRWRLQAANQNKNFEELNSLIAEMKEALEEADNGKKATPEMAQSAILVVLYVLNDPKIKPEEKELLRSQYFKLLSNATNPKTKEIVKKAEDEINKAKANKDTKQLKAKEERTKSRPRVQNPQGTTRTK